MQLIGTICVAVQSFPLFFLLLHLHKFPTCDSFLDSVIRDERDFYDLLVKKKKKSNNGWSIIYFMKTKKPESVIKHYYHREFAAGRSEFISTFE